MRLLAYIKSLLGTNVDSLPVWAEGPYCPSCGAPVKVLRYISKADPATGQAIEITTVVGCSGSFDPHPKRSRTHLAATASEIMV